MHPPPHLFPTCRDAGVTRTYHVTSIHNHFGGGGCICLPALWMREGGLEIKMYLGSGGIRDCALDYETQCSFPL